MQVPTGVLGNLTPDQEARLQQLWMFLLNAIDGADSTNNVSNNNDNESNTITTRPSVDDLPRSPNSFDTGRSSSRQSLSSTNNYSAHHSSIHINTNYATSSINNSKLFSAHLPPTPTSPITSPISPSRTFTQLSSSNPKKLRRRTSLLSNASESFVSRTASTHKRGMSFQTQSMGGASLRPSPQNAKVMQRVMASYKLSPDQLRQTLLASLKNDHPDAMLLRYLRAKKWDVGKAFVLLVASMSWRAKMHVDDDIVPRGELYALQQMRSANRREYKAGNDFIKQLRMGKNIIHGVDREGRPIVDIRVRLHHAEDQSDAVLERYIVHTIEMCRLLLRPPEVETAVLLFDMTDFSMANMDYTPVKFIIKCMENFYPECLGLIIIHKAPWFFSASWKIIKAWMNDSLVSRVRFTKTLEDLQEFIAPENIPSDLGGPDAYHYRYIEPDPSDKAESLSQDAYSPTREFLLSQRQRIASEMLDATRLWLQTSAMRDRVGAALQLDRRLELIQELRLNFWRLDPFVRARTHLDREGVIVSDGIGSVNIYPHRTVMDAMDEGGDGDEQEEQQQQQQQQEEEEEEEEEESHGSSATASFIRTDHPQRVSYRESQRMSQRWSQRLSQTETPSQRFSQHSHVPSLPSEVHSMHSMRSSNSAGAFDFGLTSHISDDTETDSGGMSMRDSFMREYDDSIVGSSVVSEVDELPALAGRGQPSQLSQTSQPSQPQSQTHEDASDSDSDSDFDFDDDDDDEVVEIHDAVTHMVGGRGGHGSVGFVQRAAVRVVNV